ncbi:MAG TPA: hypothetical protein DCP98_05455 [Sphaerochaeta sp.]|nr:hypothetical protein [Sphaerochaeta sp.]
MKLFIISSLRQKKYRSKPVPFMYLKQSELGMHTLIRVSSLEIYQIIVMFAIQKKLNINILAVCLIFFAIVT